MAEVATKAAIILLLRFFLKSMFSINVPQNIVHKKASTKEEQNSIIQNTVFILFSPTFSRFFV